MPLFTLTFDGASYGNPGPASAAYRLTLGREEIASDAWPIGHATCNVAEYRALIGGLQRARQLEADRLRVRGDSQLIIDQVAGRWKVKSPGLRPLHAEAVALVETFENVELRWVPRERNVACDELAAAVLADESEDRIAAARFALF